jgi:sialic acid synthase SpsE
MYIIADVGSNWEKKQDLLDSIYYAKKAGANCVKFQFYDGKKLYGPTFKDELPYSLPKEWIPELYESAQLNKIDFCVTPFHEDDIEYLNDFNKRFWKVASSELTYRPMLEAIAETNKVVVLSLGASTDDDIKNAIKVFMGKCDLRLMYCVSSYPTIDHDLERMKWINKQYGYPVGFSDHTLDIYQSAVACQYTHHCPLYEKHFKVREMNTPDSKHSLNFTNFKKMIDRLKNPDIAKIQTPQESEWEMVQKHNRRLIATAAIKAADFLMYGKNIGAYRGVQVDPSRISPFDAELVQGKKAKRDLSPLDVITLDVAE